MSKKNKHTKRDRKTHVNLLSEKVSQPSIACFRASLLSVSPSLPPSLPPPPIETLHMHAYTLFHLVIFLLLMSACFPLLLFIYMNALPLLVGGTPFASFL